MKVKKLKFSADHEANRTDGDRVYVCRPGVPRFGRSRLIATDSTPEAQLVCSAAGLLARLVRMVRSIITRIRTQEPIARPQHNA